LYELKVRLRTTGHVINALQCGIMSYCVAQKKKVKAADWKFQQGTLGIFWKDNDGSADA